MDVLDGLAGAEVIDHVVDELHELQCQVSHGNLCLLPEVDEAAVDPVTDGPPLVLRDQRRHVFAEAQVSGSQLEQLGADGLHQRSQANGLLEPRRHVADAKLDGGEARVSAQVPPDFLAVVDRACLDEQLDVVLVLIV